MAEARKCGDNPSSPPSTENCQGIFVCESVHILWFLLRDSVISGLSLSRSVAPDELSLISVCVAWTESQH